MPGFDGTGPRGMGPMTGGGRGFCSPWGIGAAFRAGMVRPYPMTPYPFYRGYAPGILSSQQVTLGINPFAPQMTREQEIDSLRNQTTMIKGQLERIEARINELTT